jgi:hypothetical protein
MQLRDDVARRFECSVLPGRDLAEVVTGEVEPFDRLEESLVAGGRPVRPERPAAFAEALILPMDGEGRLEVFVVRVSVQLGALRQSPALTVRG